VDGAVGRLAVRREVTRGGAEEDGSNLRHGRPRIEEVARRGQGQIAANRCPTSGIRRSIVGIGSRTRSAISV
jgi:hypothetical protein